MRTYVVSLLSSADRRQRMTDQLGDARLAYEFVDAVDGRALTSEDRRGLVDESRVAAFPQWLKPATIGCALSHHRVYERIAKADDPVALILEDDAKLPVHTRDLHDLAALVSPGEILLLYYHSAKPCRLTARSAVSGGYGLYRPMDPGYVCSSTAYMIGRDAARSLAEGLLPIRVSPDSWGELFEAGLFERLRCVYPKPVGHRPEIQSTIGYGEHNSLRRAIKRQTVWPVPQARTLNRRRIAWRRGRVRVLPPGTDMTRGMR